MEKLLSLDLVPIGSDDRVCVEVNEFIRAQCALARYRLANDWRSSSLEISWNATQRFFSVEFKGTGEMELAIGDLSKRIPLEIAKSSTCDCGSVLELGDYTIAIEDSDFRFRADYFCPRCKAKLIADKKGFRKFIEAWFFGLKKIEVKATGVGIERV